MNEEKEVQKMEIILRRNSEGVDKKFIDAGFLTVKKKRLIICKLKDWSVSLGAHGIPRLFKTKSKSIKLMWSIFISISISYCLLNLYRLSKVYKSFDYTSQSEVITEIPTLFPTITICDINPFTTIESMNFIEEIFQSEFNFSIKTSMPAKDFLAKLATANKKARFVSLLPEFGDDSKRKSLGFSLNDSLVECIFNEKMCDETDFIWFYSIENGNCYSFNSGFDRNARNANLKTSSKAGLSNGLRLKFFLKDSKNSYTSIFENGLRIFISNNSIDPMSTEGIGVSPSCNTNIVVKKSFFQRITEPYSDCIDISEFKKDLDNNLILIEFLEKKSRYFYTQKNCFDLCFQFHIVNKCKCYALDFPLNLFQNTTPCLNKMQASCYDELKDELIANPKKNCAKMCPLECNSMEYDYSLSTSEFATQGFYEIIKKDAYYNHKYFRNESNLTYELFKERSLSVNIYFSELKYLVMTQSIKMTFEDFLASIGGILGLLIGMSFMSLLEILELLAEILFILFLNEDQEI